MSNESKRMDQNILQTLVEFMRVDPFLIMLLLTMMGISCILLYSVGGGDLGLLTRQLIRFGVAFGVMLVVAQIPMHILKMWTPIFYVMVVFMLVAVLVVGTKSMGATRWLNLGLFRFQPSEIMKLLAPMMVAFYLSGRSLPPRFKHIVVSLIIMVIPMALIFKQPDLGTSILVGSAAFFALFLSGLSWRVIGVGVLGVLIAAPLMWFFGMAQYQKQRVLTFLKPESDPLGTGYHIIQSKIAIGSGGPYGKGWQNGTQSQLDFLPEQSTDFIFSVLAEEFGFVGVTILLMIYTLILLRCLYISSLATDVYSRLLGGSISLTFFVYVFVNIGMVSGLLPVVGVPLPLVSYGGTSIVTLMAGFGILMSVFSSKSFMRR